MKLRHRRMAPVMLCLNLVLAGCGPGVPVTDRQRCTAGFGASLLMFQLFFGRSIPASSEVSDRAWEGFVDQVVVPALPNGFTLFDATGAWMNPTTGRAIRERTKVLLAVLPDLPDSIAAVQRVRNQYQAEFSQQLVGMAVMPACGSF